MQNQVWVLHITVALLCSRGNICEFVKLHDCNSPIFYLPMFFTSLIKTHDSESRGQEEAGRTRRTSVLFTGSTALKLVNALNKPP